jgi:hypothetical protein
MTAQEAVSIDVDHASFAVRVDFVTQISPSFNLGDKNLKKLKDDRLKDYFLLATAPQHLFVNKIHRQTLSESFFHKCNRYIELSDDEDVFVSGSSAISIEASELKDVFDHAGVDHVILYSYGMKLSERKSWELMDSQIFRDIDVNTYDIGFVFRFDGVPFVDKSIKRNHKFTGKAYDIFNKSHNSVTFRGRINDGGTQVNIYHPIVHLFKSVWGKNPKVPETYSQGRAFSRLLHLFKRRVNESDSIFPLLLRFEVTVKARSLHEAFDSVSEMKYLKYWESLDVKIGVMPLWTYLDEVNKSIEALFNNNIFEGRNGLFLMCEKRRLIQTALIRCGYIPSPPVPEGKSEPMPDIRAEARKFAYDPLRPKKRSEEAMEIATFIYVKEINNERDNRTEYYLVDLDGKYWMKFTNPDPRQRMYQMALAVFNKLGYTWRSVLQQRSQPNPLALSLYFFHLDNYVKGSIETQTDSELLLPLL